MNKCIEFGEGSYYIKLDKGIRNEGIFLLSMGDYGDDQMTISIEINQDELTEILRDFTKMVKDV
jgi:hypothetical protein